MKQGTVSKAVNSQISEVKTSKLYGNPEQARKIFDADKLNELASSIKEQGLMNPIVVRPDNNGNYMIVAGERRFRACSQILKLESVPVIIKQISDADLTYQMIIENLQRQDISPMEEARAYAKAMQDHEIDAKQLAKKLGIAQPHRITDRVALLALKEDYQDYLAQGIITPSQAYYMAQVNKPNQDAFFRMIREGKCDNASLANVAQAFIDAESQSIFDFDMPILSQEEVSTINNIENSIERMFKIASKCFNDDGEITILQKIDSNKASTIADKIKVICSSMQSVEKKLREPLAKKNVFEQIKTA